MSETDPHFNPTEASSWAPPSAEAAAMPVDSMFAMVDGIAEDEFGWKRLDAEGAKKLEEGLWTLGILTGAPTTDELKTMRQQATALVDNGAAGDYLREQPFKPMRRFYARTENAKKSILSWRDEGSALYIKPEVIESGGGGFLQWDGSAEATRQTRSTADGRSVEGSSIDAIKEYAVNYETQLPRYGATALHILVTPEGVECAVDHDVHRTAAAKLRGEPLRFTSVVLYDGRQPA